MLRRSPLVDFKSESIVRSVPDANANFDWEPSVGQTQKRNLKLDQLAYFMRQRQFEHVKALLGKCFVSKSSLAPGAFGLRLKCKIPVISLWPVHKAISFFKASKPYSEIIRFLDDGVSLDDLPKRNRRPKMILIISAKSDTTETWKLHN